VDEGWTRLGRRGGSEHVQASFEPQKKCVGPVNYLSAVKGARIFVPSIERREGMNMCLSHISTSCRPTMSRLDIGRFLVNMQLEHDSVEQTRTK
jgi:hypothetical protein